MRLRVWWDFENATDKRENISLQPMDVRRAEDGNLNIEKVVEHVYEGVQVPTVRRVRVELILDGQRGNCARVRQVTLTPPGATGSGSSTHPATCGNGALDPGEEHEPPPGPFASAPVNVTTCKFEFAGGQQLYCNGACSWAGPLGCDQADADIFCKLKTGSPTSTALSFTLTTALALPGFCCPSLGTNIGPLPTRGVMANVWYQDSSILANHGAGTVVTGVTCSP